MILCLHKTDNRALCVVHTDTHVLCQLPCGRRLENQHTKQNAIEFLSSSSKSIECHRQQYPTNVPNVRNFAWADKRERESCSCAPLRISLRISIKYNLPLNFISCADYLNESTTADATTQQQQNAKPLRKDKIRIACKFAHGRNISRVVLKHEHDAAITTTTTKWQLYCQYMPNARHSQPICCFNSRMAKETHVRI